MGAMDVPLKIRQVREATGRLLLTVRALNETDTKSPSLCEGWTRGHVLAHVSLNADSLVNLLAWAQTGVEVSQYPSWAAREADIETFADRSVGEHLVAISGSSERFERAATELPPERWSFEVAGIGGDLQPVSNYLTARRREVEVHHVDLAWDYTSKDWAEDFVRGELAHAADKLSRRAVVPFGIRATDLGAVHVIGDGMPIGSVRGAGHRVLAWLLGRSDGRDLETDMERLPDLGAWG